MIFEATFGTPLKKFGRARSLGEARAALRRVAYSGSGVSLTHAHTRGAHTRMLTRNAIFAGGERTRDGWEYGKPGGLPICARRPNDRGRTLLLRSSPTSRPFRVGENCIIKSLGGVQIVLIAMRWENTEEDEGQIRNLRCDNPSGHSLGKLANIFERHYYFFSDADPELGISGLAIHIHIPHLTRTFYRTCGSRAYVIWIWESNSRN